MKKPITIKRDNDTDGWVVNMSTCERAGRAFKQVGGWLWFTVSGMLFLKDDEVTLI